ALAVPTQWDLATGTKLREVGKQAGTLSVSADGSTLVTGTLMSAGTVIDLGTTPIADIALATTTSASDIQDRDVSPDGQMITLSTKQGTLELLGRDGHVRASIPHAGWHAGWLDDGTVIATDGRHVTRWTATGKPIAAFDLPTDMHALERANGLDIG